MRCPLHNEVAWLTSTLKKSGCDITVENGVFKTCLRCSYDVFHILIENSKIPPCTIVNELLDQYHILLPGIYLICDLGMRSPHVLGIGLR